MTGLVSGHGFIRAAKAHKMRRVPHPRRVFVFPARVGNLQMRPIAPLAPEGRIENSPGRGPHGQVFVRGVERAVAAATEPRGTPPPMRPRPGGPRESASPDFRTPHRCQPQDRLPHPAGRRSPRPPTKDPLLLFSDPHGHVPGGNRQVPRLTPGPE